MAFNKNFGKVKSARILLFYGLGCLILVSFLSVIFAGCSSSSKNGINPPVTSDEVKDKNYITVMNQFTNAVIL